MTERADAEAADRDDDDAGAVHVDGGTAGRDADGEPAGRGRTRPRPVGRPGPVPVWGFERRLTALAGDVCEAGSRDAAERTVCEGLVDTGLYRSAWVGVRACEADTVAARTGATADDRGECGDVVRLDGEPASVHPLWGAALRTGTVRVAAATDLEGARWPIPGQTPDGGAVAAVPDGHGDGVDGLVAVHTHRPNGFGQFERTALAALGRTLGLVVAAARCRELLFGDRVVELELGVADEASVLARTSAACDCRLSLAGYERTEGRWRLYCDVADGDPAAVAATVADDGAVERCTTVDDRGDGCRVELDVAGATLVERAAAAGAVVRTAEADCGDCRVGLELPRSGAVRETVARLRATYPDLELLSRRTVDRPRGEPAPSCDLFAEATDRQRTVLERAYEAGYFAWPRDTTAEELAAELGVSSATLHWHLREAERRLLAALFD